MPMKQNLVVIIAAFLCAPLNAQEIPLDERSQFAAELRSLNEVVLQMNNSRTMTQFVDTNGFPGSCELVLIRGFDQGDYRFLTAVYHIGIDRIAIEESTADNIFFKIVATSANAIRRRAVTETLPESHSRIGEWFGFDGSLFAGPDVSGRYSLEESISEVSVVALSPESGHSKKRFRELLGRWMTHCSS